MNNKNKNMKSDWNTIYDIFLGASVFTVILLVLKITTYIDIGWLFVFMPLIGFGIILGLCMCVLGMVNGYDKYTKDREEG